MKNLHKEDVQNLITTNSLNFKALDLIKNWGFSLTEKSTVEKLFKVQTFHLVTFWLFSLIIFLYLIRRLSWKNSLNLKLFIAFI